MFQPGLPDLFKAVVVIGAAAHPIKVLRNNGMIDLRQCKPVERLITVVTRSRSNSQSDEVSIAPVLRHFRQPPDDDIWPRHQSRCLWAGSASQWWHNHQFGLAVDYGLDLD